MAEKKKYGIRGLMSICGQEYKIEEDLFKGIKKEERSKILATSAYSEAQAWFLFGIKFARALSRGREEIFLGNAEVYEIEEDSPQKYYQPKLF